MSENPFAEYAMVEPKQSANPFAEFAPPREDDPYARYPNPEAARRAAKVGIAGKLLGAAGLDDSGERAKTSWADAIGNTLAGQSLLNQGYDIGHAVYHGGDSPQAAQNAVMQIYPLMAGAGRGPLVRPSEIAANGASRGTGSQLATQRAASMAADSQAFNEMGVRPFAPAFSQGPVAATAKQLSEVPLIGAPIKNAIDESLMGARDATMRIADNISPVSTFDQAGSTLQRGLDRFRTAGIKDLEPGILAQRGIEPLAPVRAPEIMSAGAAEARAQAAPVRAAAGGGGAQTTRGVEVPAARSRDQTLIARRTAEDMSNNELQTIIRAPANQTSFAARQEALFEDAWRAIPTQMREDGSRNPQMINAVNTRNALGMIEGNIANQISGQNTVGGALAERFGNSRSNFTLQNLREIRTEVGRQLSDFNPAQASLNRSQLKQLYGSLSRDIEVGIQSLSDRAYLASRNSPNAPNHVPLSVARQADAALYKMKVADRYTRQGMDRMDNFMKIVNADKPEAAAKRLVQAALDGGRGDYGMLQAARSALRPAEWDQFSSLITRELGKPIASARGTPQEIGFSVQSFVTRFNNLDPRARAMLYGGGQRAHDISQLFRVVNRLANVEALANTSRSASNGLTLTGLVAGGASILSGNVATPLAMAGGGFGLAMLFSRPELVRWATGYAQARAAMLRAPNTVQARAVMSAQLSSLLAIVKLHPEMMPVYQAFAAENGQDGRQRLD